MTPAGPAAPSLLGRLARRPFSILVLLAAFAWLPGLLSLPPLDRDESRFAVATRQMVETGNYVDIRFGSGTRYNKPVGIYWLQAASTKIVGTMDGHAKDAVWTYRIPSFFGGLIALFLTFWCARAFASRETALAGSALLALTLLLSAESEIATTDACLLASVLGAQGVLLRIYLAAREPAREPPGLALTLAGWAALGVGVLIKGPVILAVLGVTVIAICLCDRDWRWLAVTRPLAGLATLVVIVAPWAIAIGVESHGAFYQQSLGHDFGAKILGGQETHGAPPGYYLALLSLTFWPATLFLLPAVDGAIARRGDPAIRYLLAWSGAAWLMFELVPTKLPHYILPAYPALALIAAAWMLQPASPTETSRQRILRYVACVQFVLAAIAFAGVPYFLPTRFGGTAPLWTLVAACIGAAAALAAATAMLRRKMVVAICAAALSALVFYPLLVLGVAPQLHDLWISPRTAALVARDRRPGDPPVVLAGYVEPSLVFMLGTGTRIENGEAAAGVTAQRGGLALVEDREQKTFLQNLSTLNATAKPVDQLSGFDYSRGRKEHITFFRVTPPPQIAKPPVE
jgi:4-amino-4-deoxy-L-arabinose transferase-like glycosyltransferase